MEHFFNEVIYTHRNPIHHRFCKGYGDWSYTSYSEIIDVKSEIVEITKLRKMFGSNENFIEMHRINLDKLLSKFISVDIP